MQISKNAIEIGTGLLVIAAIVAVLGHFWGYDVVLSLVLIASTIFQLGMVIYSFGFMAGARFSKAAVVANNVWWHLGNAALFFLSLGVLAWFDMWVTFNTCMYITLICYGYAALGAIPEKKVAA